MAATVLLGKVIPDLVLRSEMPARLLRDYGYFVASVMSLIASPFVGQQLRRMDVGKDKDREETLNALLNQNAELLGAAFALVVGVVLLIAELGSALGMPRAVDPKRGMPMPELLGFAAAILVTLIGRWLGVGQWKRCVAWLSSMAVLTCFLALIPYFWYQRQQVTVRAVVQSAFERRPPLGCDSLAPIERMLVGASVNGNYSLLQEGINRLADTTGRSPQHESCLVRLYGYLRDDSMGRSIVAAGLKTTHGASRARDTTGVGKTPDAETGRGSRDSTGNQKEPGTGTPFREAPEHLGIFRPPS
jgi:hypothetical protein